MKIKSPKDLWAGLMFVGFGLFFVVWAWTHYQMGSAVRMGPAYFPTLLGGLLVFLGALVLLEAFTMDEDPSAAPLKLPFNIVDLGIGIGLYVIAHYFAKWTGISDDYAILGATAALV